MSVLAVLNARRALGKIKIQSVLLKVVCVICCAILFIDAGLANNLVEAATLSPTRTPQSVSAVPYVSLPVYPPQLRRSHQKHSSPLAAAPASPPFYGPLVTRSHPAKSPGLSSPLKKRSALVPPIAGLANIAPTQSGRGAIPTGLSRPPLSPDASNCCKPDTVLKPGSHDCICVYPIKIDLILLNVSATVNWTGFLNQLAMQLDLQVSQIELTGFNLVGVSNYNVSMDIIPLVGIGFSSTDASTMNSELAKHRVRFDPNNIGGYKFLNLKWISVPAPSQAPAVAPQPIKAPPSHSSTATPPGASDKGNHSNLILVFGIAAGLLIVAIVSVLIICSCAFRKGKAKASPEETVKPRSVCAAPSAGSFPHPSSTRFIAYEELKEATNNFEPSSLLGEGGFGRVFKGVLSDGTAVAIKRLTNGGQQGDKEFLVEVEMLSRLHHRNLVKLVGYYSNRDASQNLLCYELVPNGSLEAWLHGPLGLNCPLDWDTRMKIALDAARGLAYLHEDSQPCVIHRDFKASNILLENNFNAKVADFGLAKQAPEGRTNYLSTRVMGTFGYVAPEYAMTGHLLVKSDVYSYGVVLLELLSGRKPVEMSQPSGQENLVTWSRPILRDKDRIEDLADPSLGGKYPKEDFLRVCTIAAACVAPEASQRPTMGEVVQSLKMVQRVTEYQDSTLPQPNLRQSSTTFESDGTSSIFSSGPYSGLSGFDNDHFSRTATASEDLHEGR